jgi:uncharacterized protein (DUF305 family)
MPVEPLTRSILLLAGLLALALGSPLAHAQNAESGMMSGMEKMNQDMKAAPMTGDADKDFVAMMIPHHQGAIDMAEAELRSGKDPVLRQLAKDIIAAQNKEIADMHAWQAAHQGR